MRKSHKDTKAMFASADQDAPHNSLPALSSVPSGYCPAFVDVTRSAASAACKGADTNQLRAWCA